MRPFVSVLLRATLIAATAPLAHAQSPTPAPPPATSQQLRENAAQLLQSHDPDNAAKAAELLQKASQIDLNEAQTRHLDTSIWTTLAPVLTTLILAGTLLFNIYQARVSDQEKRVETQRQEAQAEKKRYADALELLQKSTSVSPAAALINSFPDEPFRSDIRSVGRTVLLNTKSVSEFRDLFNILYSPVTIDNLAGAKEILRTVNGAVSPLIDKTWLNPGTDMTKLTPDERARFDLLTDERTFVGEKIAAFIRQTPAGPPEMLDLRGLGFDNCDLSGADLRGARISNSSWNFVNLDGCDLRGITEFSQCWLYFTAWWHAGHIDKPLLDYFKSNQPFYPDMNVNTRQPTSAKEYAENIARLEASAQQPSTPASVQP